MTIAAELGALLPELIGSGPPPPAWEVAFLLIGGLVYFRQTETTFADLV